MEQQCFDFIVNLSPLISFSATSVPTTQYFYTVHDIRLANQGELLSFVDFNYLN